MKKIFFVIFDFFLVFIKKFVNLTSFANRFCERVTIVCNQYMTFHLRPLNVSEKLISNNNIFFKVMDYSDIGIVIQGPLKLDADFTYNTIKLYMKIYPNVNIVLSTWNDEDRITLNKIKKLGVVVLENERPATSGSHNINYQIISTFNGIKYLKGQNIRYCLKTRTDMRFMSVNSLSFLINLINTYKSDSALSNGRIIEIGSTICKYRVWSLCDLFQFAYIDDLYKLWDIELDNRNTKACNYFKEKKTVFQIVNDNIAEIYLHRSYAKKLKFSDKINSIDYYEFIKSEILIIDKEMIDLFWFKYDYREYGWVGTPDYEDNDNLSRLNFSSWFQIYNGMEIDHNRANEYIHEYEG